MMTLRVTRVKQASSSDASPQPNPRLQLRTVSPPGTALYLRAAGRGSRLASVDRQGRSEALLDQVREHDWPRVSPDGNRIVLGQVGVGSAELWVF